VTAKWSVSEAEVSKNAAVRDRGGGVAANSDRKNDLRCNDGRRKMESVSRKKERHAYLFIFILLNKNLKFNF
jgi:hypothetical protein